MKNIFTINLIKKLYQVGYLTIFRKVKAGNEEWPYCVVIEKPYTFG